MQFQLPAILFYFFLTAVTLQVVYWLFFLIGLIRIKVLKDESTSLPGVSIIVAARNELNNLEELIPALMVQEHPDYEVIVVNDRSNDGSFEYLIGEENKFKNLKILHIHDLPDHISSKKYALTLGIKAAKYNQVLFTDADCLPFSSSWVSYMAAGFNQGADILLGFSNYIKLPGMLNYFIRFETLLTGIEYLSAAANKLPFMGVGRNLAYKKDLFLENKGFFGFQKLIGGDDDLFVNKYATSRNTLVMAADHAMTLSKPKTTWSSYWHQKVRHLHVGKYYSLKTKLALSVFNLSWIFTWIFGIWGILAGIGIPWIIYGLILREIILFSSFIVATKKLGIAFEVGGVIFVDILFTIYYIFVGIKALFVKTISWA